MDPRGAANPGVSRRVVIRRLVAYALLVGTVLAVLALTGSIPSADEARDFGERSATGPTWRSSRCS